LLPVLFSEPSHLIERTKTFDVVGNHSVTKDPATAYE